MGGGFSWGASIAIMWIICWSIDGINSSSFRYSALVGCTVIGRLTMRSAASHQRPQKLPKNRESVNMAVVAVAGPPCGRFNTAVLQNCSLCTEGTDGGDFGAVGVSRAERVWCSFCSWEDVIWASGKISFPPSVEQWQFYLQALCWVSL